MTQPPDSPAPHLSIVIPVYNEEAILRTAIVDLQDRLGPLDWDYEIIIAENGSRDKTAELAHTLSARYSQLRSLSVGEPNYGKALRAGILAARGTFVICEEIDLCDTDFHQAAVLELESGRTDMVIGSKLIAGAMDQRPMLRHVASIAYTGLLRGLLGFRGTDTHGLKAFRREAILPIVEACVADRDVFASELVIRTYRAKKRVVEIPIRILEKRPPSINLFKRVPNVLTNLAKLTWAIRVRG
jgi:glycosyltransferase involved in cell wall biosynthesis